MIQPIPASGTPACRLFPLFTIAVTVSGTLAGIVSDRIGYKPVFLFTHTLMTPVLQLLLQMSGGWVHLGAALAKHFQACRVDKQTG